MKKLVLFSFSVFIFSVNLHAGPAAAPHPLYQVTLGSQSKVWLTGDSTLHPYASTATVVNLEASFQQTGAGTPASLAEKLSDSDVLVFKFIIAVQNLKSGEKGLDKNMYKALKAETFPTIEFRLSDKHLLANVPTAVAQKRTSNGMLLIAGKQKLVSLESQIEILPEGIHIFGEKNLLMSDYGVKPPTILGFIKVKDQVTVHFDLVIKAEEPQSR